MEPVAIAFKDGINRLKSAPITSVYDMTDCILDPLVGIRSLRSSEVTASFTGQKPWIKWNDQYLDRTDGIEDYATHNGNLYAVKRRDVGATPSLTVFGPNHSTTTSDISTEPPQITIISKVSETTNTISKGILKNSTVGYVAIPYNKREERGPFVYFSLTGTDTGSGGNNWMVPQIGTTSNSETVKVDLYRTVERDQDGNSYDFSFYYIATLSGGSGLYYDNNYWPNDSSVTGSEPGPVNKLNIPTNLHCQSFNLQNAFSATPTSPGYMYSTGYPSLGLTYKGFGSNCIFSNGDRMLYGGVEWCPKLPQPSYCVAGDNTVTTDYYRVKNIGIQTFYDTSSGRKYGQTSYFDNINRIDFHNTGETGIAVYVFDAGTSTYKLYKELLPNRFGTYAETITYTNDISTSITSFTAFSSDVFTHTSPTLGGQTPVAASATIYDNNGVFMSYPDHPQEVTFDNFFFPRDEEVLGIYAARLSEAEQIKNYSFYVLTDKASYVGNRSDIVVTYDSIVPRVGVKSHLMASTYYHTIAVNTKYGLAFQGTDERIYHLTGRQFEIIDWTVPNVWFTSDPFSDRSTGEALLSDVIADVAYEVGSDYLYIGIDSNKGGGIWIYSFPQRLWVGKYSDSITNSIQYIEEFSRILLNGNAILNESGKPIGGSFVTQEMFTDSERVKIREVSADYKPIRKLNVCTTTVGNSFTLTQPDTTVYSTFNHVTGEDEGSLIYVELISYLGIISTTPFPSSGTVVDNFPSVTTSNMQWFPRLEVVVGASSGIGSINISRFKIRQNEKKFPNRIGSGFQFTLSNFDYLKTLYLTAEKV